MIRVIKGVNLGNWLVLEKWMSPHLFAGTDAEDETQLCLDLDEATLRERYAAHRGSYITQRDFVYLASHGIDAVRIPVPFSVFGDRPPQVGCIEYLDRAFEWAEEHDMRILLDLHTVPEGQNGFDNSGISGVCKWHQKPDEVEFALTVLERLTARYRDRPSLWGVEVVNEPISQQLWDLIDVPRRYPPHDPDRAAGSEPVPTAFLRQFYTDAYRRIRAVSESVTVVFHDGFRIREWDDFFTASAFEHFVVDTHLYLMVHTLGGGDNSLEGYLRYVRGEFAGTVQEMSKHFPLIIGEWCLDTMSPEVAALPAEQRRDFHRALADAQLAAWKEGAAGWFYWNYKLLVDTSGLDGWDMGTSFERGYLPRDLD